MVHSLSCITSINSMAPLLLQFISPRNLSVMNVIAYATWSYGVFVLSDSRQWPISEAFDHIRRAGFTLNDCSVPPRPRAQPPSAASPLTLALTLTCLPGVHGHFDWIWQCLLSGVEHHGPHANEIHQKIIIGNVPSSIKYTQCFWPDLLRFYTNRNAPLFSFTKR